MQIIDIGPSHGQHVVVGKVAKPHGVKGEVKIYPYSQNPRDFKAYKSLILVNEEDEKTSYNIEQCRSQPPFAVLRLEGINDREGSESLKGSEVWVEKKTLPKPPNGAYFRHDLEGLEVAKKNGQQVGILTTFMPSTAHPIMVVKDDQHEYLIPVVDEFIVSLDITAGTLVIDPPEGLLEINL